MAMACGDLGSWGSIDWVLKLVADTVVSHNGCGKANNSKPKMNQKINQTSKMNTAEPQTHCRQNRVFGTTRSINIPEKPVPIKSITKTKIAVPQRQPKPIRVTQVPNDITSTKTQSPENANPKLNKKSDTFPPEKAQENDSAEPKTPVESSHVKANKSKVPATPFYIALHCSKCRFDKLETSSYWVVQIKMAESVGKHFVASDFFRLALESHAEKEWREVAARYGLLKVESSTSGMDSSTQSSSICGKNESDMS
ncbi:hypothetical protein SESBI_11766 [Sesbania bispinosa]|nr:hypothetical protein SESBI_11766 [Sesbania bispinosa]